MKKSLLFVDYIIQLISFIFIILTSVMLIPLFLLVPFGAWQVLSATIKAVALRSKLHAIFALCAGGYGTLIMACFYDEIKWLPELLEKIPVLDKTAVGVLFVLVVPIISAVFYIRQSYRDYETCKQEEKPLEFV